MERSYFQSQFGEEKENELSMLDILNWRNLVDRYYQTTEKIRALYRGEKE